MRRTTILTEMTNGYMTECCKQLLAKEALSSNHWHQLLTAYNDLIQLPHSADWQQSIDDLADQIVTRLSHATMSDINIDFDTYIEKTSLRDLLSNLLQQAPSFRESLKALLVQTYQQHGRFLQWPSLLKQKLCFLYEEQFGAIQVSQTHTSLNSDTLTCIFSFLVNREKLMGKSVCKDWQKIITQTDTLWRHIDEKSSHDDFVERIIALPQQWQSSILRDCCSLQTAEKTHQLFPNMFTKFSTLALQALEHGLITLQQLVLLESETTLRGRIKRKILYGDLPHFVLVKQEDFQQQTARDGTTTHVCNVLVPRNNWDFSTDRFLYSFYGPEFFLSTFFRNDTLGRYSHNSRFKIKNDSIQYKLHPTANPLGSFSHQLNDINSIEFQEKDMFLLFNSLEDKERLNIRKLVRLLRRHNYHLYQLRYDAYGQVRVDAINHDNIPLATEFCAERVIYSVEQMSIVVKTLLPTIMSAHQKEMSQLAEGHLYSEEESTSLKSSSCIVV